MEDHTATIPTTPKPSKPGVDKTMLLLFTLMLGGIGGHKFYLRKYFQGVLYILFCWTLIPSVIALVECIIYLSKSQEELDKRYPGVKGSAAAVALVIGGGVGFVFLAGILAALAIPRFLGATNKSKAAECKPTLKQLATLEEAYFQETGHYTTEMDSLGATLPSTGTFEYRIELDPPNGFVAKAILLKPLGDAKPGDEATYTLDGGIWATGALGNLISPPRHHHDD